MLQNEYSNYFNWDNNRFEIYESADRWYQGANNPESPVINYIKVETACGQEFIIKHDLGSDEWYLCNDNLEDNSLKVSHREPFE